MHTPSHIHDIFIGRQKLFSDQKENKVSLKIRALSPGGPSVGKTPHLSKEEDAIVKERSTKKIAEALNAKISQLKAKYTQLASSIQNSPNKRKILVESKENAGGGRAIPKTSERKMRRHNSQENIGTYNKGHATNPTKGILKQSSKANVNPEPSQPDSIRKDLFRAKPHHVGKQSLGSVAMKRILDQAKERSSSRETDVIKNINELLKHLEEMKSPRSQKRNELNTAAKDMLAKTELRKASEPASKKSQPEPVQRNAQINAHSSMPKTNIHKRARSDCDAIKARICLPRPTGDRDNDEYFMLGQEEPRVSNRFISRRPSNSGTGLLLEPHEKVTNKEKHEKVSECSTKATSSMPQGEEDGSYTKMQDVMMLDKERLIKYNQQYWNKHKEIPPTSTDYYKFVKLIGKGAFGKVTLGIHKLTGKYVAIKTIEKSYMKDEFSRKKVFREVYILKKIRHANVIRLLEVFESSKHLLIVMEFAGGGDLLQYVKKHKRLSETEAKTVFKQVVYGMGHIHSRSVLHRDIKLDNILLDQDHGVKICDFGVSKIIDKTVTIKEQCGTPAYIAPEIISDQGYKGFSPDHWSLGVLLYAMLNGTVPFKASNMKDLHRLIKQGQFTYAVDVSKEAKSLIEGLLRLKPEDRLTVPEILAHPWLKQETLESDVYLGKEECVNPMQEDTGQPDINSVNVENLFYKDRSKAKLSYADYCYIANDFYTQHIDEGALRTLETFGYPRSLVIESLHKGDLNHAVASYNLLVLP